MKRTLKLLALALAVIMLLMPMAVAEGLSAEEKIVQDALPLLRIINRPTGLISFSGAPSQAYAWAVLAQYVNGNLTETQYSKQQLQDFYKGLFAEGELDADFPIANPQDDSQFTPDSDGYSFMHGDGEAYTQASVNRVTAQSDGSLLVDLSVWRTADMGDDRFEHNAFATLMPDENALFGATVRTVEVSEAPLPKPSRIEATHTLEPQSGNIYDAKNAIDGKLATCWAYDAKTYPDAALTIYFDHLTELRGLIFTAGYAKSEDAYKNNRRVALIDVAFGDGSGYGMYVEPLEFHQSLVALPFGDVCKVSSIQITVPETYPGEKFDDMCISEIEFF